MTTQNDRNRRAGKAWEAKLLEGLRSEGFDTERTRDTGAEDEGDLVIRWEGEARTVIEAKAGKMLPAEFVREARVEGKNYADHRGLDRDDVDSIVIVKRKSASWKDAYVLTTVRDYFGLEDG